VILARNPTPLCRFLSLFLFRPFRLSHRDEGRAKRECTDRSKGHRVPPAHSVLPLRFVPFFLVIRISINLVVRVSFFVHLCHRGRCPRTTRRPVLGRTVSFFSLSLSRQVQKKIVCWTIVYFSYVFYCAPEDTWYSFEKKGVLLIRALRVAHSLRRVTLFFSSLCNLIKTAVTHPARVSYLNFSSLLNFLFRYDLYVAPVRERFFPITPSSKDERFLP